MIRAENISFKYDEDWVFRDVSFSLAAGQTAAILGPNGRGKTTLLKTVLGLLRPAEGRVMLDGRTGYVAQRAEIAFSYNVIDIVVMGRAAHIGLFRTPGKPDYDIARRCLTLLGIHQFADRPFNRLSGGERQLVMIARALASECRILVLDEPASALDFRNQDLVLSTLRRIAAEEGIAVLFTTHFPQHAVHIADHGLLLHQDRKHDWGAAAEVLTEAKLEALYGLPIRALKLQSNGQEKSTLVPVFS